jgi:hypothetical protein
VLIILLFVRTPSSGKYLEAEKFNYPRGEYWDSLLAFTNCKGIYFEDFPEIASFVCPEWSHLVPADGVMYTKALINILEEKGWSFPHKQNAIATH